MKIIILNFKTKEVFIFPYDENIYEDGESFFESEYCRELDIRLKDCNYMVVDELNIKIR